MFKSINTSAQRQTGFVLLVTLITLLSITLVFLTLSESTIASSQSSTERYLFLIQQQRLNQLASQRRQAISRPNFVAKLEELNRLDYVLSNTRQFNFSKLTRCELSNRDVWQSLGDSYEKGLKQQGHTLFALLTHQQSDGVSFDGNDDIYYLVLFLDCIQPLDQHAWFKRFEVYKVFDDGRVQLQVARHNLIKEPINQ